ncbi:hypothetical protein [Ornithinimicrobium kibberense]|uniref:hypothetical protein n=1 Tax=Ornithinimicrobium kibberense TaxID=282060 RepID=UPI00360F4936
MVRSGSPPGACGSSPPTPCRAPATRWSTPRPCCPGCSRSSGRRRPLWACSSPSASPARCCPRRP